MQNDVRMMEKGRGKIEEDGKRRGRRERGRKDNRDEGRDKKGVRNYERRK